MSAIPSPWFQPQDRFGITSFTYTARRPLSEARFTKAGSHRSRAGRCKTLPCDHGCREWLNVVRW